MNAKLIIIAVLFLISAIIAILNTEETTLNFLLFSIKAPLIVMIIVIFIFGLVTGIVIAGVFERNKKLEYKSAEKIKRDSGKQNIDDE
jgi:uncharacterized integral membrane protein